MMRFATTLGLGALIGCGHSGIDDTTEGPAATEASSSGGPTTSSALDTGALDEVGGSSGSGTAGTTDGATGFAPDNLGPCCDEHPQTGCEHADVAACVCAGDPYCCVTAWDQRCADEVGALGCGVCPGDATGTSTTSVSDSSDGDATATGSSGETGIPPDNVEGCCHAHASTGCVFPGVAACVCDADPSCCADEWHDGCVGLVGAQGCGVCPPP